MKKLSALIILLSMFCFQLLSAQKNVSKELNERYSVHVNQDILVGAGFNAVYDTGLRGPESGKSSSWNFSNPFYVSGEYFLNGAYSIYSILSFNKYVEGKKIDGYFISNNSSASFIAFDVAGKYSFRQILDAYAIDPFVFTGFGINSIGEYEIDGTMGIISPIVPAETRVNYIIGVGTNYWFSQYWAVNTSVAYKIGIGNGIGDQLQPTLGVIYQLTN